MSVKDFHTNPIIKNIYTADPAPKVEYSLTTLVLQILRDTLISFTIQASFQAEVFSTEVYV